jgi:hypothetical protein
MMEGTRQQATMMKGAKHPVPLIGFKAIAIALVGEVFVFPITESPPDERGIFQGGRICTCIML